jgi:hypothetical protein
MDLVSGFIHMAHKTVVMPSEIIVPFAAFATDNMVRVIGKDIRLWPRGQRWRFIGGHHALHRLRVLIRRVRGGCRSESDRWRKRSAGVTVGEGGTGVVQIGVDGLCSGGDGGGGVRGIGDELGVERGGRTGSRGESRRGERRSLSSSP